MANPVSHSVDTYERATSRSEATNGVQRGWALLTGGALGAICFALCALFFGHLGGMAIALGLAIVALARRAAQPAILFVAAAALCGAGLLVAPVTAIVAGALCCGGGLIALASANR